MHIHILGICGTFMGSLAVLAKELGYKVTGSDQNVYPPMSTQLEAQGIELMKGYDPAHFADRPDMIVIGNTCSRGNPAVEYILEHNLPYRSGPQWLSDHVLQDRWVLAVAGTHGKTTTTSMLAWILEFAKKNPGYLVGGVPKISIALRALAVHLISSSRPMNMTVPFSINALSSFITMPEQQYSVTWSLIMLIYFPTCLLYRRSSTT